MTEPSGEPRVLYREDQIRDRVAELARQISLDYAGKGEVLLVGVLKGAFMFLADLSRKLTVPRRVDFIAVSSYGDKTVSIISTPAKIAMR